MSAPEVSPVFRKPRALPRVSQPNSPWTVALGVAGAGVMGFAVFVSLSHARESRTQITRAQQPQVVLAPAASMRVAMAAPSPALPPLMAPEPVPAAPMANPSTGSQAQDLSAPAVVVDLSASSDSGNALPRAPGPAAAAPPRPTDTLSPEELFAARVGASSADTARATRLRDVSWIAPQGTVISAVLETAIDSDLPGSVRAVVSRDVRGFDGRQVLIPRGSKLIGQYKSGVAVGQTRAFVIWSRILTPQGVSIDVASPAADELGRGGLSGETDSHFLRRFGAAILLSVLDAGAAAAANSNSGGNTYVIGSPVQANQVAAIALQKQIDIPPTIKVAQGTPMQVFVARDLDFSTVAP